MAAAAEAQHFADEAAAPEQALLADEGPTAAPKGAWIRRWGAPATILGVAGVCAATVLQSGRHTGAEVAPAHAAFVGLAADTCPGDDDKGSCLQSKCCKQPGYQCYAKNDYWASCMAECTPGPNLFDEGSSDPWSCKPLGERAPGQEKKCAGTDEDCMDPQCCSELGMQCYAKNATFGSCKASCEPGVDMSDKDDWKPWSCKALGPRSRVPASWIQEKCTAFGADNCASTHCCKDAGHQCFLKNDYYGQCLPGCADTQYEKCRPVGTKTPQSAATILNTKGTVGKWVESKCSKKWENCINSGCCHEVGATCFAKNEYYGTCETSCNTTLKDPADNKTWSCEVKGPKSWGLATKGYPSLYCFSLYMPEHYEGPLLRSVLKRNIGIFACDGYDVFANENDTLGTTADGITVRPVLIPVIRVGTSQDGTAGNAKLFMAVWDKIIAAGKFRYYDWTVKVDPDAVLLPWRLRDHMRPHVGEHVYVVNCNKVPGSPNFPMMFGALEVFSQSAMKTYAQGSWKCGTELPWKLWGEDYFMTHCLDYLGVGRISDFGVLGDNMCVGAHCEDQSVASFHPFKTEADWHACWDTANGHPPPTAQPPQPAWR